MFTVYALFKRKPDKEQAIGRHILPIGKVFTAHRLAMAGQKILEFLPSEPSFPGRRLQLSPMLGVLVNDREPAARLYDPAHFIYGTLNIDRVLQRFRGVDSVER